MPQLIYLRNRYPHSFLVFTYAKEGYCLRDFSKVGPAIEVERQSPGRGTTAIRAEGRQEGNYLLNVAERAISDHAYWHKQTVLMNKRFDVPPAPNSVRPGSWIVEHLERTVAAVVTATLIAALLAWLGLKQ